MNKALAELIRISNTVGKDETLVQGGGGNTSVKTSDGKYMFVKASGTALKDMDTKSGWRRVNVEFILSMLSDNSLAKMEAGKREIEIVNRLNAFCDDDISTNVRPSVEAILHAILDKCVIHLHPDVVGAYVNAKNGKTILYKLFKHMNMPPLWVSYTDPGFSLAKKTSKQVCEHQKVYKSKPEIIFLEKHGLFVCGSTANSVLELTDSIIKVCRQRLKAIRPVPVKSVDTEKINEIKLSIRNAFFEVTGERRFVSYFNDEIISGFSRKKNAKSLLSFPALTPDELVYANGSPLWLEKVERAGIIKILKSQAAKGKKLSSALLVKGIGLFAVDDLKIASVVRDIAKSSFFVRANAAEMGGINSLNKRQRDFINNWEAEAFRKSVASGTSENTLKEHIAVVTGAASGLGKSIALGLAGAGAAVMLADIDKAAANETASVIKEELPGALVESVCCDVTDEKSVKAAFDKVLNRFGGLDILINAAGVAPAYPLTELPVDKWRLALEVNLTGYFLMAKYAAKVMIAQGIGGNIINISSKTGLDASKDNTPYNATKAGELHMARGWAMELGKNNIRVNCVCPGNVFEGSKIWNPQYIKVCAKKYGIKPEDVIPYYVNKTMLKKKIEGHDIADAVVFLVSDKSRMITGQTVVVDAGQVMVR